MTAHKHDHILCHVAPICHISISRVGPVILEALVCWPPPKAHLHAQM
jgi:hypothetical protein